MIDWKRKITMLAALVTDGDLRAVQVAIGCQRLMELETRSQDLFWTWQSCQGTREEREQVHEIYIESIRAANKFSDELQRIGGNK
jgi:hypothetical protein